MIIHRDAKPTITSNFGSRTGRIFSYLNYSIHKDSKYRKNIHILLDVELRKIEEGAYKFISEFERIDGMCIRESYVVNQCTIRLDNIQNINQKGKELLFKSDII